MCQRLWIHLASALHSPRAACESQPDGLVLGEWRSGHRHSQRLHQPLYFLRWVKIFSNSVPNTVARPLLLLFDRYLSHLSVELVELGERLGILFVCLPANATHLIQPLDIAGFSAYKKKIRALVRRCMMDTGKASYHGIFGKYVYLLMLIFFSGYPSIDKRTAVQIGMRRMDSSDGRTKLNRQIQDGRPLPSLIPANGVAGRIVQQRWGWKSSAASRMAHPPLSDSIAGANTTRRRAERKEK